MLISATRVQYMTHTTKKKRLVFASAINKHQPKKRKFADYAIYHHSTTFDTCKLKTSTKSNTQRKKKNNYSVLRADKP